MNVTNTVLLLVRLFLGITFIFYGVVKVLGGQFRYEDFILDSRNMDGPTFVWSFYGYSPIYGRLIGVAEMVPGILLLIPRTQLLGALLLFPVAANIAVMDFCFDFPAVKYFALLLTLLDIVLLAADRAKLKVLFQLALVDSRKAAEGSRVGEAAAAPSRLARARWLARAKWGLLAIGALLVALFLTNLLVAALTNPVDAAAAYCVEQGWNRQDLVVQRWRMTSGWSGFDRQGEVEFQFKGTNPPKIIRVTVRRPHSFTGWQVIDYK